MVWFGRREASGEGEAPVAVLKGTSNTIGQLTWTFASGLRHHQVCSSRSSISACVACSVSLPRLDGPSPSGTWKSWCSGTRSVFSHASFTVVLRIGERIAQSAIGILVPFTQALEVVWLGAAQLTTSCSDRSLERRPCRWREHIRRNLQIALRFAPRCDSPGGHNGRKEPRPEPQLHRRVLQSSPGQPEQCSMALKLARSFYPAHNLAPSESRGAASVSRSSAASAKSISSAHARHGPPAV